MIVCKECGTEAGYTGTVDPFSNNVYYCSECRKTGTLGREFDIHTRPCPVCGGVLDADLEWMDKHFGELWYSTVLPRHQLFHCTKCGGSGTLGRLEHIALSLKGE